MPRIRPLDPCYDTKRKLIAYLRQEMREQRITQEQMADRLGTYQETLSNWLNKMNIPLDVLLRMFRILKTPKDKIGELMS